MKKIFEKLGVKKTVAILLAIVLVLGITVGSVASCSAASARRTASYNSGARGYWAEGAAVGDVMVAEEAVWSSEPAEFADSAVFGAAKAASGASNGDAKRENGTGSGYERKIIYTATVSVRADDPRAAVEAVKARCAELGGYLSDSYERTYSDGTVTVTATLKVPADGLNDVLREMEGLGKVESSRLSSDDITRSYYDIDARLRAAKAEEEQLLALYAKCANVEEMLAVREQLASVRSDIESYQGTINLWDHQVSYATIELTVNQTVKTPAQTEDDTVELWAFSDVMRKIGKGFSNSWRSVVNAIAGFGIFLANVLLPAAVFILVLWLVIRVIVKIVRARRARRKAKAEKKAAADVGTPAQKGAVPAKTEKPEKPEDRVSL